MSAYPRATRPRPAAPDSRERLERSLEVLDDMARRLDEVAAVTPEAFEDLRAASTSLRQARDAVWARVCEAAA